MNFELTREQNEIKKAAREFAEGEFEKDLVLELEEEGRFPVEIWKKAGNLGFIGVHMPEEYGGQGLGLLECTLIVEEFCRRDSSVGTALGLVDFGSELLLRFGNEEQKRKYLPPITAAESISSVCLWEDKDKGCLHNISTLGERRGDVLLVNGKKVFVLNIGIANYYLVLCQTDSKMEPSYLGQSIAICESERCGLSFSSRVGKMGITMVPMGDLFLRNVEIPLRNIVGKEESGHSQVAGYFTEARIRLAAQAVGIAQGAFERAVSYANKREQFGRKIIRFQAIQHKIADMASMIERTRLLVHKAAWKVDRGMPDKNLGLMAKMEAGRTAVDVTRETIQVFGGYGYIKEQEVEHFFRDAWMMELFFGSREAQKTSLASAFER